LRICFRLVNQGVAKRAKSCFNKEMSINSDTGHAQANTPDNEVEGLRRLVEEQRKLIDKLFKQLQNQKERIEQLETELRAKQKLKGKPRLSASLLNQPEQKEQESDKRAGSAKKSKKANCEIDEERQIQPDNIPNNAKFNGYRNYDVQELIIKRHNIRFQIAEYITEDGKTVVGELPTEYQGRHYGSGLVCYVMYQHYQCRVPQPLIYEQLSEWGIEISTGQVKLKKYQQQPSPESSLNLQGKFDEIFGRCYIRHGLLNDVLNHMRNHKLELLRVLDCPELPLHNNAAETDIREYVTRRKISGGTRSELGRKARDTFVGLKKTCRKLGISFWKYLTSRLYGDEQVLSLSEVIRAKAAVI
jgi:Transposase IS66 family